MCTNHAVLDFPSQSAIPPEAEAFGAKLMGMLNAGAASLMISIGHRTGLFDALADGIAVTSAELAAKAALNERYVREWLGAMATAGIVEIDSAMTLPHRFRLPSAHAMFLGREAAGGNLASTFQFVAELGTVETRIVQCFREGGGVPYQAFDRFHELMAEESDVTVVAGLIDHVLPLAPGLAARLETGIDVADIGCGAGRALNRLAAAYPRSRFTGYDLCAETIIRAQQESADAGLANVHFVQADATDLDEGACDLIFTFDAIHDQGQPARVLANIRRMLRPGGVYICQEIDAQTDVADNLDHPMGTFVYTISTMHCMSVSLSQGGLGLGAAWGEQLATTYLRDAGFEAIEAKRLPHDIQNIWFVARG